MGFMGFIGFRGFRGFRVSGLRCQLQEGRRDRAAGQREVAQRQPRRSGCRVDMGFRV